MMFNLSECPAHIKAKVEQARQLLKDADLELHQWKRAQMLACDRDLCKCGHRRDKHGVSTNINYTEGLCLVDGCECCGYLHSGKREKKQKGAGQ